MNVRICYGVGLDFIHLNQLFFRTKIISFHSSFSVWRFFLPTKPSLISLFRQSTIINGIRIILFSFQKLSVINKMKAEKKTDSINTKIYIKTINIWTYLNQHQTICNGITIFSPMTLKLNKDIKWTFFCFVLIPPGYNELVVA